MSGTTPALDAAPFSAPRLALALRDALRANWPTADLLRLVRQMRSDFRRLRTDDERDAFCARPESTGDDRWDAMIAGNVEDLALGEGVAIPAWTRGPALPTFWFVGEGEAMRAYAFARSPFSLQVRGVMVDPADLESV